MRMRELLNEAEMHRGSLEPWQLRLWEIADAALEKP
jgi:hypothetical protein